MRSVVIPGGSQSGGRGGDGQRRERNAVGGSGRSLRERNEAKLPDPRATRPRPRAIARCRGSRPLNSDCENLDPRHRGPMFDRSPTGFSLQRKPHEFKRGRIAGVGLAYPLGGCSGQRMAKRKRRVSSHLRFAILRFAIIDRPQPPGFVRGTSTNLLTRGGGLRSGPSPRPAARGRGRRGYRSRRRSRTPARPTAR